MPVQPIVPANQQPDLADVFDLAMRRLALNLRVCMPAKVVRVLGPQFIDVQPLLKKNVNGVLTDYPVVSGALVSMPIGGDFGICYSLKPGDTGLVLCADRSLDAYMASDGTRCVDPADARSHQLTDAIFVPGLLPHAKQTPATDDMVLSNGRAKVRLDKRGKFAIGNDAVELLAQVEKLSEQVASLAQAITIATSTAPGGPLDPKTIASATAAATAASTIQAAVASLSQGV